MDPGLSVSHRAVTQEMFVLLEEAFNLDLGGRSTQVQGLRAPKAVCDSEGRQRESPTFQMLVTARVQIKKPQRSYNSHMPITFT